MNYRTAAAVAVAIGTHWIADAAPTPLQCANPTTKLYVAGSSSAESAFAAYLARRCFGGASNVLTYSGTSGDFKAYCGASTGCAESPVGSVMTVYYRGEGDSIMGALPIVSGKPIKFLDISSASCQVASPPVTGSSTSVGATDGWGGCVTSHAVDMGITDLEPSVFVAPNYPTVYSTTVFGSATGSQLAAMAVIPTFAQVFGIYVNTSGLNGAGVGQAINLSRVTVANILEGNYTDWSQVPSASGGRVSTTSKAITVINHQAGSGARAAASIYFLGTNCGGVSGLFSDPNPLNDAYTTDAAFAAAAATPGSITYATIDHSNANLSKASLNGVVPSNLAAATGQYGWWFEGTAQRAPIISSPNGLHLYNFLVGGDMQDVATAPHADDIVAIPAMGTNLATVPVTATASNVSGHTIYINAFTRGGASCTIPAEMN